MEEEIKDFCRLETNRYTFLKNYLEKRGIPNKTLKLGHSNNIMIRYAPERYGRESYTKTLMAHFGRNIHSGADSTDKLEKRAFNIMEQLLGKIVEYDIPFKYTYAKATSNTGKIINARSD